MPSGYIQYSSHTQELILRENLKNALKTYQQELRGYKRNCAGKRASVFIISETESLLKQLPD